MLLYSIKKQKKRGATPKFKFVYTKSWHVVGLWVHEERVV